MEKIKFDILRDSHRRPTVTICTIYAHGETGIGIAIRSMKDNPVERIGKAKARGRAMKALVRRGSGLPISRIEAYEAMDSIPDGSNEALKFGCVKSIYRAD